MLLTAAAVDDESLERNKEFFDATKSCGRIFNYYSKKDTVVGTAYRLGDFPEFDAALGAKGTEHPDRLAQNSPTAFMVDCTEEVDTHGGYRHWKEFYDYWATVANESAEIPQFGKLRL
ncbi:MAG: hypothetical protein SFV18_12955 [Bryobacteraceae bacterium]|nr:hypothetical protein [Bryobacteraceae bacterium]